MKSGNGARNDWEFRPYSNIAEPFLREVWYFRIPVVIAFLSFFLFSSVSQALEIYQAFFESENIAGIKANTVLVFLLSFLVWYCSRQLAENRKVEDKDIGPKYGERRNAISQINRDFSFIFYLVCCFFTYLIFSISVCKIIEFYPSVTLTGLGLCIFLIIFWIVDSLVVDTLGKCIIFGKSVPEPIKADNEELKERIRITVLIVIPRLLALVPLLGIIFGYRRSVDIQNSLKDWDYIVFLASGLLSVLLFFIKNRTLLFKSSKKSEKNQQVGINSLFGPEGEILGVTITALVFCAFTIPLNPKLLSLGTVACILICILLFSCLYLLHASVALKKVEWGSIKNIIIGFTFTIFGIFLILFGKPFTLVDISVTVGSIGIICFFLLCFLFISTSAFHFGHRRKFPLIGLILGIAFFSSYFNWNDNHQIRQVLEEKPDLISLDSSFNSWLNARKDRNKEETYPVYIVSAQGGGIYAAYHAAMSLARLQELSATHTSPTVQQQSSSFANHVFAISSVSGGSVGAATFSSLVKSNVCNESQSKDCFTSTADRILGEDFLSPLLATGLFADFAQRFLPRPIYDWDRARGLEFALENAWSKTLANLSDNPLSNSFYQHWDPKGSAPALIINATIVETGERVVISPFKISIPNASETPRLKDITAYKEDINFNLSTAAGLSARFPLITPVAWFKGKDTDSDEIKKIRLADGGYFDNSGMLTALDIGQELERYCKENGIDNVKFIYLSIIEESSGQTPKSDSHSERADGLNELLSPVRTLWNTRSEIGKSIIQQAEYIVDPSNLRKIGLDSTNLPLGWYLAEASQEQISEQLQSLNFTGNCDNTSQRDISIREKELSEAQTSSDQNTSIICEIID
ncbi:MAG: hypothetical protein AAGD25_01015 [Cyanobacteria bacterium P01_F01_bin.150]